LCSQVLVAYTIELDNEAEHRLPHWTTREDDPEGRGEVPWLVSYPLWANVLQYLGHEVVSVVELEARARTSRLLLGGLRRWGYVGLRSPRGEKLRKPQPDSLVRATRQTHRAAEVWRSLPSLMDERWRARFGDDAMDGLSSSLGTLHRAVAIDPPAFLPPVYPTQNGKAEVPVARTSWPARHRASGGEPALSELLSGVLLALTVDLESVSRISLPIAANTLRVLDDDGIRIRDLPRLTGVSKEANAMCAGWLERRGCAVTEPDPSASRGKVLRLTAKGRGARAKFRRVLSETEEAWRATYGAALIDRLRAGLEVLVGDGVLASSSLAEGLEPYPDNWRTAVKQPETLPHYPMVLHRGAYPDGS
jgi:DNA-binding MarR family transcriptional regulator